VENGGEEGGTVSITMRGLEIKLVRPTALAARNVPLPVVMSWRSMVPRRRAN
jgi:hypothetical protein